MSTLTLLGLVSMVFVSCFTYRAFFKKPGAGQSPRAAIVEAWLNIITGFSFNFVANLWLIPMMSHGGHMSLSSNFWGGWVYTTVSIVRSYGWRRAMNWWQTSGVYWWMSRRSAGVAR